MLQAQPTDFNMREILDHKKEGPGPLAKDAAGAYRTQKLKAYPSLLGALASISYACTTAWSRFAV